MDRKIIAVCSEIHTKHGNTLCGQNIEFFMLNVYRFLVGKPEGRRPLGRPRRGWADNIRMDLQEVGCVYMDWIGLAQDKDS